LKEEVKAPTELLKIDLINEPRNFEFGPKDTWLYRTFDDIAWAAKSYKPHAGLDNFNTLRSPEESQQMVLKTKTVQDAIREVANSEGVEISVVSFFRQRGKNWKLIFKFCFFLTNKTKK